MRWGGLSTARGRPKGSSAGSRLGDPADKPLSFITLTKSHTEFAQDEFDQVWKDVFDFSVS
jgi:hypothetical protein